MRRRATIATETPPSSRAATAGRLHRCPAWLLAAAWWALTALPTQAQQVRIVHWNVHGNIGTASSQAGPGAAAIARILNYLQPDVVLLNEVADGTVTNNTTNLTAWVAANLPYMAAGPYYVSVSTESSSIQRNAALSRYPILNPITYPDIRSTLRGMFAFELQLAGANRLQLFYVHLKCCSDGSSCQDKQDEADLFSGIIKACAATNSAPYIFAGDLNEDEQNPECTLSATYHPISTLITNGGFAEFKPTTLSGEYRTWSTATTPSIRLDYILAATNRLSPVSGNVFSTMDWAVHGLYTNAGPLNLADDSQTASDHYAVFANYNLDAAAQLVVSPGSDLVSGGLAGGPFSPSSKTYSLTNSGGASLSWSAAKTANWITLSAAAGTLSSGSNATVVVSINANASGLTANTYSDTVFFTNNSGGAGSTSRLITLLVTNPAPQLSVGPAAGLTSIGPPGGPFAPASQIYTLTNTGGSTLGWTASNSANWLTLSPAGGMLAPAATTTVSASLNGNAANLGANTYSDTISFANTNNGLGNTTRPVSLTVSGFGFYDNFSAFSPGNLVGQNNWLQVGAVSSLPLQILAGQVVVPFAQSVDNQDAYKNFAQTSDTVFYGLLLTVSNAPASSTPSYFAALWTGNNATGFANYRLSARDNGSGTYVLAGRITGQTGNPYAFGAAALAYGTPHRVIVEADSGGTVMVVYVDATSTDLGAQTAHLINTIGSGTPPSSVGCLGLSQFASGAAPNVGLSIARAVVSDSFATVYNYLTPPSASFTATPTSGAEPLVVTFTDASSGAISSRSWDFGDGSATNTTDAVVSHSYAAGTYTVGLTVTGPGDTASLSRTNYIVSLTAFQNWQVHYFGNTNVPAGAPSADPDGDGINNFGEFQSGTDPTNHVSVLRITSIAREADSYRVSWTTGPGKTNALQRANAVGPAMATSFNDIFSVVTLGSATNFLDLGAATSAPASYYRVRLKP